MPRSKKVKMGGRSNKGSAKRMNMMKMGALDLKKKIFVSDANDRNFTANGIDLVLHAGVKVEISLEMYKELSTVFPYLKFSN